MGNGKLRNEPSGWINQLIDRIEWKSKKRLASKWTTSANGLMMTKLNETVVYTGRGLNLYPLH